MITIFVDWKEEEDLGGKKKNRINGKAGKSQKKMFPITT